LSLRFILSLASCKKCLVIDDQLDILPISSHVASIEALPPQAPVRLGERRRGLLGVGSWVGCGLLGWGELPSLLWQDENLSPAALELLELKESLQDTQPVGVLVDCCKTLDQVYVGGFRPTLPWCWWHKGKIVSSTDHVRTCWLCNIRAVLCRTTKNQPVSWGEERDCMHIGW
jgi:hypothetical protein